jgi:DNA invertase Pin-like site-specific DNA recombinase
VNSTTAVAYIRVSTKEQAMDGVSLAAQEQHIRAYCHVRHLEIISIVSEHSVSGSVPLSQRRGGLKLLEYLQTNKVFHVVVIRLDRLFRDAADALMQTKQWNRNGIALHLLLPARGRRCKTPKFCDGTAEPHFSGDVDLQKYAAKAYPFARTFAVCHQTR